MKSHSDITRASDAKSAFEDLVGGVSGAPGVHVREPGLVSGSYLSQAINASALTTVNAAPNRIEFFPFIPSRTITVNELAIEVTTLLATSLARIGIYDSNASGNPNNLLVGSTVNLDCATVGAKTVAIAATALNAGSIYWLAVHSSSTQTYRGVVVAALQSLGHDATLNTVYTCRRATVAFGALPAVAPATTLTAAIVPWFRLKVV
jgi:hypothetical protein